jgi:hypothetical protein
MNRERLEKLNQAIAKMKTLIPPEIKLRKELSVEGIWLYIFRHDKLGDIGQMSFQGFSNNYTHFLSQVVGETEDPMTKKREEAFGELSGKLIKVMEEALGKADNDFKLENEEILSIPRNKGDIIESKLLPCNTCGAFVVLLIFSNLEEMTIADFEDYARMMYLVYSNHNVPTWIIGIPVGDLMEADTISPIMQVWPEKGSIFFSTAKEFNLNLDTLINGHCKGE